MSRNCDRSRSSIKKKVIAVFECWQQRVSADAGAWPRVEIVARVKIDARVGQGERTLATLCCSLTNKNEPATTINLKKNKTTTDKH